MAYTTIDDPTAHFQVLTYRGDSSSTTTADRTLTNEGTSDLQPDLVWIANRDSNTNSGQRWWDSTRGVGENKGLTSSGSNAEGGPNDPEFGYVNTLHSDGFGVRAGSNDSNGRWTTDRGEGGGDKYVAFQWKANAASTASVTESGSGDGGINACTYQANTTAGFSIIKYTGHRGSGIGDNNHTNVTHGLSSAPTFVIIKNLTTGHTLPWIVLGAALAEYDGAFANRHLKLNDNSVRDGGDYVANTAPSSDYVFVGNNNDVNYDGLEFIMYAWHEVQGYSKFGTYEGNGDADGTFVYTGFRPAFVITKSVDSTSSWYMFDHKREGYNVDNDPLEADSTATEATTDMIDFYSNGFKLRIATDPNVAETYAYMAFAEQPFVTSSGIPATAR